MFICCRHPVSDVIRSWSKTCMFLGDGAKPIVPPPEVDMVLMLSSRKWGASEDHRAVGDLEEVILRGLVKWKLIIAVAFREHNSLVLASVYRSALYFRKQFNVTHCSSAGQMLELNLELYIEMPYLVLLFSCTFPYTASWIHMTQIYNEQQPLTNRRVHRTGFFQRRAE